MLECRDIKVKHGEEVVFELPEVKSCGQFSFLNPSLRPVFVIEGNNATNLISPYDKRLANIFYFYSFELFYDLQCVSFHGPLSVFTYYM